jgi:hypothetical protein
LSIGIFDADRQGLKTNIAFNRWYNYDGNDFNEFVMVIIEKAKTTIVTLYLFKSITASGIIKFFLKELGPNRKQ